MTQSQAVAAVDLLGLDAQAIPNHASEPFDWEEPIVPSEHHFRRYVGPAGQRPWLATGRVGLAPTLGYRLEREFARYVVVEDVDGRTAGLRRVPGAVREHLLGALAR